MPANASVVGPNIQATARQSGCPRLNIGRVHIAPTRFAHVQRCAPSLRPSARARRNDAPPSGKELTYQGGQVIRSLHPHLIFWLPSGTCPADNPPNALPPAACHFESGASATRLGDANYEQSIATFFEDAGGTAFYAILLQYYGHAHLAPLNAVTFNPAADVYVDTTTALPHSGSGSHPLFDSDIQNEIDRAIRAKGWPSGGVGQLVLPLHSSLRPELLRRHELLRVDHPFSRCGYVAELLCVPRKLSAKGQLL